MSSRPSRVHAGCRDVVERWSDRVRAEREPDGDRFTHAHRRGPGRGSDPVHRGRRRRRQRRPDLRLDFGDNTTSTEQNPSKTYLAAGTFTATVTVSDGKGGSGTAIAHRDLDPGQPRPVDHGRIGDARGRRGAVHHPARGDRDRRGRPRRQLRVGPRRRRHVRDHRRNPSLNLTTAGDYAVTLRASDAFGGVATRAVTITALAATPDPTTQLQRARLLQDGRVPPRLDRPGHHGDQAARPAEQLQGRRDRGRRAVHRRLPRPL